MLNRYVSSLLEINRLLAYQYNLIMHNGYALQ